MPWKRPPGSVHPRRFVTDSAIDSLEHARCVASGHVHRFASSQVSAFQVLLATASLHPSQPCDDITPADASILTGYAMHITELDVGVENAGDKGTPSTFGRFTVIRLEHRNTRESGAFFTTRVLIFCVSQHGRKHALSMTYLTLTSGSGFQLHVVTVEERPRSMHNVRTLLDNGKHPLQATSIRWS